MIYFKKLAIYTSFILLILNKIVFASEVYFIDFSMVLNQSKAGAEAQTKLKKKFEAENKKFTDQEKSLRDLEAELIQQKKILSNEDYLKKLEDLRKKVSNLQKDKQDSLNAIAKSRNDARQELLKAVNPILKRYMTENNIRVIIDKESVILGDTNLEITNKIIEILNKELTSIKIN